MELRGKSAWSYRSAHARSVEPTVLACMACLATGDGQTAASASTIAHEAANWLASIQRADGAVPVSEQVDSPGWATPYAHLLWCALSGYREARERSRAWLLETRGQSQSHGKSTDGVIGHDQSLVGWPWVLDTHSWLEPTALAILALAADGHAGHPRARDGIALILDRALDAGGWNYGNTSVFGKKLRPQPGPTGLALMAIAAVGLRPPAVSRGLAYLRAAIRDIEAPVSLGWSVLGLRAHDALPIDAEASLARSYSRCAGKPDAAMGLALLLLAASEPSLSLMVRPRSSAPR